MRLGGSLSAGMLGCVLAVASARADNPYQQIVDRNVFGLKPMDDQATNAADATPPPTITLEGIDSIFGRSQVIFRSPAPPDSGQSGEKTYLLDEGETEDDISVVAIDQDAGTVKFNNHGTEQTLNLKTDAAKPGGGGGPGPNVPLPTFRGPGGRRIPQRMLRRGGGFGGTPVGFFNNNNGNGNNGGGGAYNGTTGGGSLNPVFSGGGSPAPAPAANVTQQASTTPDQAQQPQITPEEQTILIELERQRTQGDPDAAPLPITELTPGASQDADGSLVAPTSDANSTGQTPQ